MANLEHEIDNLIKETENDENVDEDVDEVNEPKLNIINKLIDTDAEKIKVKGILNGDTGIFD